MVSNQILPILFFHCLFFQVYSQSNCNLECSLDYAYRHVAEKKAGFVACVPWFYPTDDERNARICSPWEATAFQELMGSVPAGECSQCLTDCEETIYQAQVSAAAFRKCDHTNTGVSDLCDLENGDMNPSIWAQAVINEFESKTGTFQPNENGHHFLMKMDHIFFEFSSR